MLGTKLFWNVAFMAVLLLSGCKEFLEPSLEPQKMVLYTPADSAQTNSYQQMFWWEKLEDALVYRLQIGSPDFVKPVQLVLDTLVKGDKFVWNLDPGTYEWRVRAENGSSHTAFTTRKLTVFPSSLTSQTVLAVGPANQFHTALAEVKFQWGTLYGAQNYRLQLDRNQFADEQKLVLDVLTNQSVYVEKLTAEGSYQFRVRAENQTEISKWSVVRTVVFDQTAPEKVVLVSPANRQLATKPVQLSWQTLADADRYEVMVLKSDKTTIYNGIFPVTVSASSWTLNVGDVGETLAWKVRAVDRSGNKGEYSEVNTLTIQ